MISLHDFIASIQVGCYGEGVCRENPLLQHRLVAMEKAFAGKIHGFKRGNVVSTLRDEILYWQSV